MKLPVEKNQQEQPERDYTNTQAACSPAMDPIWPPYLAACYWLNSPLPALRRQSSLVEVLTHLVSEKTYFQIRLVKKQLYGKHTRYFCIKNFFLTCNISYGSLISKKNFSISDHTDYCNRLSCYWKTLTGSCNKVLYVYIYRL